MYISTVDTPSKSTSSTAVTVGVVVGSVLLLLALCVLVIVAIVILRRRINAQTVDLKGMACAHGSIALPPPYIPHEDGGHLFDCLTNKQKSHIYLESTFQR